MLRLFISQYGDWKSTSPIIFKIVVVIWMPKPLFENVATPAPAPNVIVLLVADIAIAPDAVDEVQAITLLLILLIVELETCSAITLVLLPEFIILQLDIDADGQFDMLTAPLPAVEVMAEFLKLKVPMLVALITVPVADIVLCDELLIVNSNPAILFA